MSRHKKALMVRCVELICAASFRSLLGKGRNWQGKKLDNGFSRPWMSKVDKLGSKRSFLGMFLVKGRWRCNWSESGGWFW